MNKLIRLSHSGIEYFNDVKGSPGYVWNFYSGCRHQAAGICPPILCWAETITRRFRDHYPNGFEPTFYPEAFLSPLFLKKPSHIGVCFMGDLFGDWINPRGDFRLSYLQAEQRLIQPDGTSLVIADADNPNISLLALIKYVINSCPQHTFVFLTKNPDGMVPWSPFPNNCEIGTSVTNPKELVERSTRMTGIVATVKWCSLEPLLWWDEKFKTELWGIFDWVAIGALTGNKAQIMELAPRYPELTPFRLSERGNQWGLMPPIAWLKSIVEQLDACGTKVFLKDNLYKWICKESPYINPCFLNFIQPIEKLPPFATLRQEYGARAPSQPIPTAHRMGVTENKEVEGA
jgi:hypothetical protein